jgi:hypothetical protein
MENTAGYKISIFTRTSRNDVLFIEYFATVKIFVVSLTFPRVIVLLCKFCKQFSQLPKKDEYQYFSFHA